jgi:hypothetical protein
MWRTTAARVAERAVTNDYDGFAEAYAAETDPAGTTFLCFLFFVLEAA